MTKDEAGYVSDAQRSRSPESSDQCSNCVHFIPRDRFDSCHIVEGVINPIGWCRKYEEGSCR